MILGIDIGGSAVKLAGLDNGRVVFTHYEHHGGRTVAEMLTDALCRAGCRRAEISAGALTGVGAERFAADSLGFPLVRVPEVEAIGRGGTRLAGVDTALVASMGTGTAFVLVQEGRCTHLGGTGIGGGTLCGLGARVLGTKDAREIDRLSQAGDLGNVDLRIGDLFSGSETLNPRLTAANLAKTANGAADADWAAGLVNLVLQAVGTMSVLACGGHGIGTVVVTGALARLTRAAETFALFQEMYGLRYQIPPHAACATAIGAALEVAG